MTLSDGRNSFASRENGSLYLDCSKEREGQEGKGEVGVFPQDRHLSPT